MGKPSIAIVDTGSGNLRSVEKALARAGANAFVSKDADKVGSADKVVVPGQGAFGGCMAGLMIEGGALRDAVLASVRAGKPYLGICMGLQVLFATSEEEPGCAGLGLLPGKVVKFAVAKPLKVPHMGWNACRRPATSNAHATMAVASRVLADTADGTYFYFVHSYYPVPADQRDVALVSDHGLGFCAAVARDNIFACQFHPEKSQRAGLVLLSRFVSI
jgi:glutamine amidotransferase